MEIEGEVKLLSFQNFTVKFFREFVYMPLTFLVDFAIFNIDKNKDACLCKITTVFLRVRLHRA